MQTTSRMNGAIAFSALLCVACGTAGFAAQTRGSVSAPHTRAVHIPQANTVAIRKDPFVSPVDDEAQEAPAQIEPDQQLAASALQNGPGGAQPGPVVPNVRVQGVIVGDQSYAVIDDGGKQRIVSVGDVIGDTRVARITLHGVELQNGIKLLPTEGTP